MTVASLSPASSFEAHGVPTRTYGRRSVGVILLLVLAILTSVARIPARAERADSRPAKTPATTPAGPGHC